MKLIIADDHEIFRQSLSLLLSAKSRHEVVADIASFEGLPQAIEAHLPDAILLDYHMPGDSPLVEVSNFRERWPELKIVFLTGTRSSSVLKQVVESEVEGIVHKQDDADIIVGLLDAVEEGKTYVSATIQELIAEVDLNFTRRELEVLEALVAGRSPSEIALQKNISARTVEKHKENMMKKCGVTHVAQLVDIGHKMFKSDV